MADLVFENLLSADQSIDQASSQDFLQAHERNINVKLFTNDSHHILQRPLFDMIKPGDMFSVRV